MSFFPPQKLIQEIPSVYETLHNLGATLWIPPAYTGGVNQFVYPDATPPLVGADAGTVTYSQDGGIPEILGGSPQAEFDDAADQVYFNTTVGDPLNLSNGGSLSVLLTIGTVLDVGSIVHKSTSTSTLLVNGYWIFFRSSGEIVFHTSSSESTRTELTSSSGVVSAGDKVLITTTLDLAGNAKIFVNCSEVASGSSMEIPSDTASELAIGTDRKNARPVNSPIDFIGCFDGKLLTEADCTNIAAMCGNLG